MSTPFVDSNGQHLFTHPAMQCMGEACTIHNPSNHAMKDWPQAYRHDLKRMERSCEHQVSHPDPDDINLNVEHACDGCCTARN